MSKPKRTMPTTVKSKTRSIPCGGSGQGQAGAEDPFENLVENLADNFGAAFGVALGDESEDFRFRNIARGPS